MLFLIIGKPKEGRILPERKEFLELVVKEWEAVIEHKETGRINEVYGFRDGTGGIIIIENESKGNVEQMVRELPLYSLADWEILPMMSAEEGEAKARRMLQGTE